QPRDRVVAVRLAVEELHPEPLREQLGVPAVVRLLQGDDVRVPRTQDVRDRADALLAAVPDVVRDDAQRLLLAREIVRRRLRAAAVSALAVAQIAGQLRGNRLARG